VFCSECETWHKVRTPNSRNVRFILLTLVTWKCSRRNRCKLIGFILHIAYSLLQRGVFFSPKFWLSVIFHEKDELCFTNANQRRSHWPRGQRHAWSSLARTLGSWIRIALKAYMSVCVNYVFVLSCVRIGPPTGWSPVQGVLPTISKMKKVKWNKVFHGCPMLQSGGNREEREREINYYSVI
jgi:hypothetical protein